MNVVTPTNFEVEASFYSLATEYLHAAEILVATPVTTLNVSLVTYFLLGHAAELLMKSCLYKAGTPLQKLKCNFGHDLGQLISEAQKLGHNPPLSLPNIHALAKNYKAKSTEYRQLKEMSLPPNDLLLQEVKVLDSRVFDQVIT